MDKLERPISRLHKGFGLIVLLVFGLWGYHSGTGLPSIVATLAGMLIGLLSYVLLNAFFQMTGRAFRRLPTKFNIALLAVAGSLFLAKTLGFGLPDVVYYPAALALVLFVVAGLSSWEWLAKGKNKGAIIGILVPIVLLALGVNWFLQEGHDPFANEAPPRSAIVGLQTLADAGLTDPSQVGPMEVETYTYGSGTDQKRPEYAMAVRDTTPSVDASLLLPEWKGKKKKWRERYWGFGVTNFPLNGRVYMPKGTGPFPLTLIVHGNHSMIDYSDGGYAYLGELLASRGIIAVSVDENFINGHWSGDFRGKEMPTRAWLLLKHLEQWQAWNSTAGHALFQKVDMENIMLVGHSRGGEAVSIAAAFNHLPAYPDNALQTFDFHFSIKGVVAIAPTDYRYHRTIELENLHFLSLQGSYDADETSFWGLRPYRRLEFTDGGDWFKAGVYIHRANHGQFNSSWGRSDFGGPMGWMLNTKPLLSGADQRKTAAVFISAFAAAALKNEREYLPVFQNYQLAGDWLPPNHYLSSFQSSSDYTLQNFEEDIDLLTGMHGVRTAATGFKVWREEKLTARDGGSQDNNALVLGWDYGEKMETDSLAHYTINFPDSLLFSLDSFDYLSLSLAPGDTSELKRKPAEEADSTPLDFYVQLIDQAGNTRQIALSKVKSLAPPLRSRFTKMKSLDADMIGKEREVQLETFVLPLEAFQMESGAFDGQELRQIRLLFNNNNFGMLVVDDIGLGKY